jgi:hypothetical protein
VARIHSRRPKFYLNAPEEVIIDANFSTLWLTDDARVDSQTLLALLNSSWIIACLEAMASVLGGGALKVEAAHLRRLPLPRLNHTSSKVLGQLGAQLLTSANDEDTREHIDHLVAEALVGEQQAASVVESLRKFISHKQLQRSVRR